MTRALRELLLLKGYKKLDIGDVRVHLETGEMTRKILLDDQLVGMIHVDGHEIDWQKVEDEVIGGLERRGVIERRAGR